MDKDKFDKDVEIARSKMEVGGRYRIFYNKGNPNNETIYVRGIVDDYVVYRVWMKTKQSWQYRIDHLYFFHLLWKDCSIKKEV